MNLDFYSFLIIQIGNDIRSVSIPSIVCYIIFKSKLLDYRHDYSITVEVGDI